MERIVSSSPQAPRATTYQAKKDAIQAKKDAVPDRGSLPFALGVERIGLVGLYHPWAIALITLALIVLAGFGVTRLQIDDSLSQLFRARTPEFQQYEALTRRFPSSEYDLLAVVEGKTLLEREPLSKLRDLVTDLQLIDGTRGVISLFSARHPPQGDAAPASLFPEPLPEGPAYDALIGRVTSNEIIRGKLLSQDGTLALVVLAIDPGIVGTKAFSELAADVRRTVDEHLLGTGLTIQLSGVPVMQAEIRDAVQRDRILYNAIGFLAGCFIAALFFRRLSLMVVAAAPPLVAILLSLGALGWLDVRLNLFLNVMTPLIMVISFSDSMQLTFAARDRLMQGDTKPEAFRQALLAVGPACVLTHATAGLSFTALLFSSSDLIRTFGEAGLAATAIALVAVLVLVPLLGLLLVRGETDLAAASPGADRGVDALRRLCAWIARRMVGHPGRYSALGLLVVAALALIYAQLQPRYRLADQVPDREQAVAASGRLDAKLTGANPIDVLIELPTGKSLYDPDSLQTIAEVHGLMEHQADVGNVWSLETLHRWLAEKAGHADTETLKRYVDVLPEHLTRRFVSAEWDAVVVTGRVPDLDASQLLPVVERLDRILGSVRSEHPGTQISVTGLSAIAARNSADMIGRLNRALTVEIVFVAAFIGLAFRAFWVMLASILPGIFPVVSAGSLLWATGEGLQFASVVALTVSFGLGLSATIHFLNRLRLEERPDESTGAIVERATVLVGPALILTTAVLASGLAVTVLSDLPSLRLFGWLSALSMVAALVADLFILRPTVTVLRRWSTGR